MAKSQQAISLLLVLTLVVTTAGLDGCSKKASQPSTSDQHSQAPQTTYAMPTADQLSQLVAPIALFPDNLLAQVLAGSTYPDQITAAYQWLQTNASLKGAQLMQAVDQQSWDASVKGLTQFPDVLQQMASNLSWTSALGDAYYNIPQSVMNAVQVMRQRAYDAGNLKSNQQQNISVEKQSPGAEPAPAPAPAAASSGQPQVTVVQAPPQTIVIQPAQPDVVYVPTYNPTAVYGAPVPAYPGYSTGEMVATSLLSFGVGIAVGAAISGGGCCGWGWNSWGTSWHNSAVVYNHNTYISNSNTFVNRNNYYNRNVNNANLNNVNRNNINRNNLNANNVNRNNFNANNVNRGQLNNANYRTNNFNSGSTPQFSQQRNQQQFRNDNQGNFAQQRGNAQSSLNQPNRAGLQGQNRPSNFNNGSTPQFSQQRNQQQFRNENQGNLGQQRGNAQSNLNQQNRAGLQAQNRPSNQPIQASDRQPDRGYGEQANRGSGNGAFGNFGQGGNTRTNSARGQQSLENRGGGASGDRAARTGGGNVGERSGARGGGGGGRRR